MNKHEQIRIHLSKIRYNATPGRVWSISDIVLAVQEELDAIKALLQPEPETLAASVLRLTEELDAVTLSNAYLRGCNNRLEQNLRALEEEIVKQNKYIEMLKKDRRAMLGQGYSIPSKEHLKTLRNLISSQKRTITTLRIRLGRREACLKRAMEEMQRIKLSLELHPTKDEERVRELEHDLRHVRDQLETILEQTEQ